MKFLESGIFAVHNRHKPEVLGSAGIGTLKSNENNFASK